MSGRKRKYMVSPAPVFMKRKRVKRTSSARPFRAGRDRVGGYYGRYSGRDSELKFFDKQFDVTTIAIAGELEDSINEIPQGVTESQRVGRKCTIRTINWHYLLKLTEEDAVATPPEADTIRMIMYLDKQCNGAIATVLGILETAEWQSFRNLSESGRFQILMDKTVDLNRTMGFSDGNAVGSSSEVNRSGAFYKKCNIPLEFSSTTGAIAEIRSNNIGILLLSRTNQVDFESKIRIRFSDQG